MIVFSTRSDFSAWRKSIHEKIAFVPTMGALHSGHLELVKEAKKQASIVVVSIFVNPTQFNNPEDFKKYPQNLPSDLKKCEENGVDIVLAPTTDDMYAEKEDPIPLPDVALPLEGALRPGHFQGVVTIVSKLFKLVQPDVALFGLKDYQQVRVIQEMTVQQKFPIQILPCPTVRSPEGLALSSRNERLSSSGLQKALKLPQTLKLAQDLFKKACAIPIFSNKI
ncbi:MAG: pantoate--beta-alanine ligase [Deltaproteobacteria bacterium]|nr:MAG: pantoate--beta-alanine ligase [Deltaproteobacteria bacterium]